VSRKHAVLILDGDEVLLEDRNSGNGTFVNGRELQPNNPIRLRSGDVIEVGDVEFVFRCPEQGEI